MTPPKRNADDWINRHPRLAAMIGVTLSALAIGVEAWHFEEEGKVLIFGRIIFPPFLLFSLWVVLFPRALPRLPTPAMTPDELQAAQEPSFRPAGCVGCLLAVIGVLIGVGWLVYGLTGQG